jgi:hypothetical protein
MRVLLWLAALLWAWKEWVSFAAKRPGISAGAFNGSSDFLSNIIQTAAVSSPIFFFCSTLIICSISW